MSRLLATAFAVGAFFALALAPGASAADEPSGTGGIVYSPGPAPGGDTLGADSGGARYAPDLPRAVPQRKAAAPKRRRGKRPHRRAPKPKPIRVSPRSASLHSFPVTGPHDFGGRDARFGAGRPGHIHQGQDILASEGTPVVAPRGGVVTWRAYQARGAGFYLVVDAVDEPYNYVFMHLRKGSIQVQVGDRVRTGQVLAEVGNTGASSAPHLHFEIWDGPWYNGGTPIDPLPFLLVWD